LLRFVVAVIAICPRLLDLWVVVTAAHEPLDGEDSVLRVDYRLPLGDLAHQPLAALGECDDRGAQPAAFGGRNHDVHASPDQRSDRDRITCPRLAGFDFCAKLHYTEIRVR
jgi:hypothetical protein